MPHKIKDLCTYRIEKARADLKASRVLLDQDLFSQSLNRSYYAIFHITRALTALDGFETRKHTGLIGYFNREYIAGGIFDKKYSKIIKGAERMRNRSDYDDFYIVSKDDTRKQLENAEVFIEEIEKYIREKLSE